MRGARALSTCEPQHPLRLLPGTRVVLGLGFQVGGFICTSFFISKIKDSTVLTVSWDRADKVRGEHEEALADVIKMRLAQTATQGRLEAQAARADAAEALRKASETQFVRSPKPRI